MSYFFIGKGIVDFKRLNDDAFRMENQTPISKKRYKIFCFAEKHGIAATLDAFKISRSTF